MSGHTREACHPPRWARRWRNRLWICECGKAWSPQPYGSDDGSAWIWEEWRPNAD